MPSVADDRRQAAQRRRPTLRGVLDRGQASRREVLLDLVRRWTAVEDKPRQPLPRAPREATPLAYQCPRHDDGERILD